MPGVPSGSPQHLEAIPYPWLLVQRTQLSPLPGCFLFSFLCQGHLSAPICSPGSSPTFYGKSFLIPLVRASHYGAHTLHLSLLEQQPTAWSPAVITGTLQGESVFLTPQSSLLSLVQGTPDNLQPRWLPALYKESEILKNSEELREWRIWFCLMQSCDRLSSSRRKSLLLGTGSLMPRGQCSTDHWDQFQCLVSFLSESSCVCMCSVPLI